MKLTHHHSNITVASFGALLVSLAAGAHAASVAEFQTQAALNANLIHQYKFEGASVATAGVDSKSGNNLTEISTGSGNVANIGYNQAGFDGTSTSFAPERSTVPPQDLDGAHLKATGANQITLGNSFSFEAILKATSLPSGGNFDLGYIISSRVGGDRGYFLVLGDGNLPSPTHPFSSTLGGGYNPSNTNLITGGAVNLNDWYYVAGSYTANPGVDVTWTNYVANLTTGQTVLSSTGAFINAGGTYPLSTAMDVGVGGRWDAGEAFPGMIDEINLYNAALSQGTFQAHLNALIPEPSVFGLLALGLVPIMRRRRSA